MNTESRVVFFGPFIEIAEFIEKLIVSFTKFKSVKAVTSFGRELDTCLPIFHEIPPNNTYRIVDCISTIDDIAYVNIYNYVSIHYTILIGVYVVNNSINNIE